MFVVQISLLIVTFLCLISGILSLLQTSKKSTHTLALRHMSICGVSPSYSYSYSYAICWMLVHAYPTSPRKAKWSGPHHTIKMLHFVLFHSVTCYTNSIVSCTHVNTTKLCNITCTLVATCVIIRSLDCTKSPWVPTSMLLIKMWDCTDWPQVTWDLWLGTHVNQPLMVTPLTLAHSTTNITKASCYQG